MTQISPGEAEAMPAPCELPSGEAVTSCESCELPSQIANECILNWLYESHSLFNWYEPSQLQFK